MIKIIKTENTKKTKYFGNYTYIVELVDDNLNVVVKTLLGAYKELNEEEIKELFNVLDTKDKIQNEKRSFNVIKTFIFDYFNEIHLNKTQALMNDEELEKLKDFVISKKASKKLLKNCLADLQRKMQFMSEKRKKELLDKFWYHRLKEDIPKEKTAKFIKVIENLKGKWLKDYRLIFDEDDDFLQMIIAPYFQDDTYGVAMLQNEEETIITDVTRFSQTVKNYQEASTTINALFDYKESRSVKR